MHRVALILLMCCCALAAESFHYSVSRGKLPCGKAPRGELGELRIDDSGVSYESANGKTKIAIAFEDIRQAGVSDPARIRIETYDRLRRKAGGRREYTFQLREGKREDGLALFLIAHLARPVVGYYASPVPAVFSIPAYHRHALRGVPGKIEIGPEGVRFAAEKPADSRTWLYRDIESVGNSDPFHLRVSTYVETYMFDLKERLETKAYEFVWQRVYGAGQARAATARATDSIR